MRTDTRGRWQRSAGWRGGLELSGSAVMGHKSGIMRGIKTGITRGITTDKVMAPSTGQAMESMMDGLMGRPGITTGIGMERP